MVIRSMSIRDVEMPKREEEEEDRNGGEEDTVGMG